MLDVVHGPFAALEQSFLERLKALKTEYPSGPIAVVAPSRRLADRLERLAAVDGKLALLGVRFHTFFSLAQTVVEDTGWPAKTLISDPVFLDRLLDGILEGEPSLKRLFGGETRPRALSAALRASLKDLIDAGIDSEGLEEHFGDELLPQPHERERLKGLLKLKWLYEEKLNALGLTTGSGLVRLAADRAGDSRALLGQKALLYYGFYDLTGVQLEFFEAVTSLYPSTFFFPYEKDQPPYRFAEPFFKEKLAGKNPRPAEAEPAKPAFSILSASGARDEVWACAKEILKLIDEKACRFEDIGLVARTLEPYRSALIEVFAENDIPLDLGAGEPLLRQPIAKAALNLLTIKKRDFPAAIVEDLLASPYFAKDRSPKTLRHWREAIRGLGISAGWLQWRKLEASLKDGLLLGTEEDGRRIPAEDISALWSLLREWRESFSPSQLWSSLSSQALALLQANLALPKNPKPEEEQALAQVQEAVRSLALFDSLGVAPTWEAFLESLEDKLKRASLDSQKPPRGVRARDAMDARGESFKALFLIGLKEKLFPRQVQEDPLLRDSTRQALRDPAGYWINQKASGHEEERLLFHLCVSSAIEKLTCVFPRSDESGKAQVPSLYLRELCRAQGRPLEEDPGGRIPRDPTERLRSRPLELLSRKEASLRLSLEGAPPLDDFLKECLQRLPALTGFGKPGLHDGHIGPPKEYLAALKEDGLSPSALDTLAQCGFKFFAERLLGLGRREDPNEKGEFASWVRGKIYHAVLEKVHGEHAPLPAAIDAVFKVYDWRAMGVYPVLWRAAKESMTETLQSFTAWDAQELASSGMKPLWQEKELSAPWPGPVPAPLKGLKVKGIIDRVDASADGKRFRIVDYKTSWKKKGALSRLILKGELHQLPVYAELAGAELDGAQLDSAAIYALETPDGDRAKVYDGQEWGKEREVFYGQVAALLETVATGRFGIRPDDGFLGYCGWCGLSSICRKSHGPTRARGAIRSGSF